MQDGKLGILVVCTANYCRSPIAEGLLRKRIGDVGLLQRVRIDSAGTHRYRIGEQPDPQAVLVAGKSGVDISKLRARQIAARDFHDFDLILAMDNGNLSHLRSKCPSQQSHKLALYMSFAAPHFELEVPDPIGLETSKFEQVFRLLDAGADGLIRQLREKFVSR